MFFAASADDDICNLISFLSLAVVYFWQAIAWNRTPVLSNLSQNLRMMVIGAGTVP
jgi:hypothetical protein